MTESYRIQLHDAVRVDEGGHHLDGAEGQVVEFDGRGWALFKFAVDMDGNPIHYDDAEPFDHDAEWILIEDLVRR